MSENGHDDSPGFLNSLKGLGSTTMATLQNRLELFSIELKEQKFYTTQLLVWIAMAVFLAIMTLVLLTVTVILLVPEEWRGYTAAGFTALYLIGAGVAFWKIRSQLKDSPMPFSDTISELKKDREWLKNLS